MKMTRNLLRARALALVLAAIPAGTVSAQQSERADTTRELEPVTVLASRVPISVLRVPLAVSVVGAEKLRFMRGYGLDEALTAVPGVLAQSRYGNQDVRITIRGFGARGAGDRSNAGTSRGIRVMMDGIPETEPDGRTSFDGIDLASAERIDVVRSNASSVWGNAAGGVIHVSTVPGFGESSLGVEQSGGSFGLLRTTVRGGAALGTARVYTTFTHTDFDGWRAGSASRRSLLNVGVTAQPGTATDLGLFGYFSNNLFNIPGPLSREQLEADPEQANATYLSRRERRYNRTGRIGATLAHEISPNSEVQGMVYVNPKYLQRSERGTFRDFTRYHTGGNVQYNLSGRLGASVGSRLSVGMDEAYQDGAILFYGLTTDGERAADLRDNKREGANNFGAFVQEELALGRDVTVSLGARYDKIHYIARSFITPERNDQRSFSRVTPKVGVVWHPGNGRSYYANVGGGVEAPAGNETDPASTFGQDTIYGINPLLDPIRSTTYEVGTKHVAAGRGWLASLSYDVAAYQTNVTNEIIPYRGGRFYFTAGGARRRGFEVGGGALTTSGFSLDGALTLSQNEYTEYLVDSVHYDPAKAGHFADYAGNEIVGVPSLYGSVTLGIAPAALRGVAFRVGLVGVGQYFADDANSVEVPGYGVVNATIAFNRAITVAPGVGVRGFLTVNNIGDRHYAGSAFLNPDVVNGVPLTYEPGLPRNVVVSFSLERTR